MGCRVLESIEPAGEQCAVRLTVPAAPGSAAVLCPAVFGDAVSLFSFVLFRSLESPTATWHVFSGHRAAACNCQCAGPGVAPLHPCMHHYTTANGSSQSGQHVHSLIQQSSCSRGVACRQAGINSTTGYLTLYHTVPGFTQPDHLGLCQVTCDLSTVQWSAPTSYTHTDTPAADGPQCWS